MKDHITRKLQYLIYSSNCLTVTNKYPLFSASLPTTIATLDIDGVREK